MLNLLQPTPSKPKAKRKPGRAIESAMQMAFVKWFRMQYKPYRLLLHSIPNSGARTLRYAGRMKAEGLLAGMPDLHLPLPRGGYASLYIELKTPIGLVSREQRDVIAALEEAGNKVAVVRSLEKAIEAVKHYLNQ